MQQLTLEVLITFVLLLQCASSINPPKIQSWSPQTKTICPQQCSCTADTAVCSDWSMKKGNSSIPSLPELTSVLFVYKWPLEKIQLDDGRGFKSLHQLKISQSPLKYFPIFNTSLSQISLLDLSYNNISNLPARVCKKLTYLKSLNVSWNNIQTIDEQFLQGAHELMILDLSHNPIFQLKDLLFSPTRKLSFLDLSHTYLRIIQPSHIRVFKDLFFLDLSWNTITKIPLFSATYLEDLNLSHNPISELSIGEMNSLQNLDISFTNISKLEELMKHTPKLEYLDASSSELLDINENLFSNCKTLKELNLSGNKLRLIKTSAFTGLSNLVKLHLNNCKLLIEIEAQALNSMIKLEELSLENTGLDVLPRSLTTLPNLKSFSIKNTSIWCDCHAEWVPKFLSISSFEKLSGFHPIKCNNNISMTVIELEHFLIEEKCAPVTILSQRNKWVLASAGQSALLECNATGEPRPDIIWQTVDYHIVALNKSDQVDNWVNQNIAEAITIAQSEYDGKFQVLESGQLLIRDVQRKDIGRYKCFAYNAMSNASYITFIGLDTTSTRAFLVETALFGWACAALFLLISLIVQFIKYILDRLGCECCCCKDRLSPKAKQISKLLETVENYKTAQLERLRENYNSQCAGIKDSCYYQMDKVREGYGNQSKNLRNLCDYSSQQISGARDQYNDQLHSIRDYSMGQMSRVRENYVFQRQRIRKFSAHQLIKLRETYKYQQKTLNKILETLPDLYIQNCRTGACQRSDSIMFDELDDLDIYYKVDFFDGQSLGSSQYYTPNSTLSRKFKRHLNESHSRTGSNESGIIKADATVTIENQSTRFIEQPKTHRRFHLRSFSLISPPVKVHRTLKGHKRSNSETKPQCEVQQQTPLLAEAAGPQSTDQHTQVNSYLPSLQIVQETKQRENSLTESSKLSKSDTLPKTAESSKDTIIVRSSSDKIL